ncbi:hypothetical protein [Actinomadura sp. 9N407]|uniref:hypothetical protein n=1 Tax=Actinomadura sp. 9N407 TaxID=3375154 RepID=UPI0037B410AD
MSSPDEPDPLVLEPSRRRPLLVLLAVAGVWCFVFGLLLAADNGRWLFGFLPMAISTVGMFLPSFIGAPPALRGDTVVDSQGVTRRRGRSQIRVPWDQVVRITLMIGPPWTGHKLMLFRVQGRPIPLASPTIGPFTSRRKLNALLEPVYARAGWHRPRVAVRPVAPKSRIPMLIADGLVLVMLCGIAAFALYITSPSTQAWWPGRDEAARLPDACTVVDRTTIARLVPGAPATDRDNGVSDEDLSCSWGSDDPPPEMSVRLELQERGVGSGSGASEKARTLFQARVDRDCPSMVSGLGDEACMGTVKYEDSARAQVVTRKGNVLITILYSAEQPVERVSAEAVAASRAALGRIRFE